MKENIPEEPAHREAEQEAEGGGPLLRSEARPRVQGDDQHGQEAAHANQRRPQDGSDP